MNILARAFGKSEASKAAIPAAPAMAAPAAASGAAAALERAVVVDTDSYSSGPGLFSNVEGRPASVSRIIEDLQRYAEAKVTLADLTVPLPAKLSDIVTTLRRYGVVILPAMFEGKALDNLRAEFDRMIASREGLANRFEVTSDAANSCIRLDRDKMDADLAPETAAFYAAPLLAKIAEFYYGHDGFSLNRQIFVHETYATDKPLSGDLHFDVTRMVKFWIYLDEARPEVGAIRMSPGSSLLFAKLREEFSNRMIPKKQIVNEVDEAMHPAMHIEAPAGSLVIFDTDTAHGASRVFPGNTRRIMRGHTMETKYVERGKKRAEA